VRHFILLSVFVCVSFFSYAEENINQSANGAVASLAEQLKGARTLTADFKQTIKDNKGNVLQESLGSLIVKRPNKLHWSTQQPYQYLVVTNGEKLWLHDIDLDQVNVENYNESIDKAPALLLSGNIDAIAGNYHVEQYMAEGDKLGFKLLPKTSTGAFSALEIIFNNKQISTMKMMDNFDQITSVDFSNLQINTEIADQQFNFVAPSGIEVINNDD
jgi:outer membrane lipoprotein carrier protein